MQEAKPHPRRDIIIAVDAGHGCEDPGAIGPSGTREKDVVLEIARRLAAEVNGTEGFNGEGRHGRGTVMDLPAAVQVVDDRVFVIDSDNHRVRVFDEFGTAHILAGSTDVPTDARTSGTAATAVGDGAGALAADLNHPSGLFVTATATGYAVDVADAGNHRVRRLDSVILTDGPQIDEN